MQFGLIELLQSTGPIALRELIMRTGSIDDPKELVDRIEELMRAGVVTVSGLKSGTFSNMTASDIVASSSQIIVELSKAGLRRSFAS